MDMLMSLLAFFLGATFVTTIEPRDRVDKTTILFMFFLSAFFAFSYGLEKGRQNPLPSVTTGPVTTTTP